MSLPPATLPSSPSQVLQRRAYLRDVAAVALRRRRGDEPLEGRARRLPVAHLPRDAADVVERIVLLGVDLQALLPRVDRRLGVAEAQACHAERVPGARVALPEPQRGLEVLPGLGVALH